jgi:hypothetical protein
MKQESWVCIVGPVNSEDIPHNGDLPLRLALKNACFNMLGYVPGIGSGWGADDEEISNIQKEQTKAFMRRHNLTGKQLSFLIYLKNENKQKTKIVMTLESFSLPFDVNDDPNKHKKEIHNRLPDRIRNMWNVYKVEKIQELL